MLTGLIDLRQGIIDALVSGLTFMQSLTAIAKRQNECSFPEYGHVLLVSNDGIATRFESQPSQKPFSRTGDCLGGRNSSFLTSTCCFNPFLHIHSFYHIEENKL